MTEPHTEPGNAGGGWLTVTEAALRTGKSERTVQRWCQRGVIGAQLVATPEGEAWKIDPATLPKASDGAQPVTPEVTPHSDTVTPSGVQVTPPKQGSDATTFDGGAIRREDSEMVTPTGDATVTPFSEGDANGDAILKQGDATPKASDGAQIGAELSPLAARYVAQLESENGFLRSQIEAQRAEYLATIEAERRESALTVAALREAIKAMPKALPASDGALCAPSTATSPAPIIEAQRPTEPQSGAQPGRGMARHYGSPPMPPKGNALRRFREWLRGG